MYQTCSAKKEQITTLVAISASGGIIPPFLTFPGERFIYNPLDGVAEGAYKLWTIIQWTLPVPEGPTSQLLMLHQ